MFSGDRSVFRLYVQKRNNRLNYKRVAYTSDKMESTLVQLIARSAKTTICHTSADRLRVRTATLSLFSSTV